MTYQARYRRQVMGFLAWILGCGLTPLARAEIQGSVQIQAGWNLVAAPSNPEHRCAWTRLGLTLWATGRPSEGDPAADGIERSEQVSCRPEGLDPTARASEPSDQARVVWVFAKSGLELPMAASPAAALVPAGWNMFTVPEETVYADPNILRVSRWDAQAQRYKRVRVGDALEPGYGYHAFLEEAGAPFQDDCLGSKWSLETARTLIETCPFSGPTPNGPAPRPLDPALPTHIVLESATEDSTARGAMQAPGSIAPESSAHFTVTQTASGAWNIIENQPPGAQLPPLLRIHIGESPQNSDASLSETNPELPQKGAVLRVAELIAELSERFSPIEGVVWDERGSSAWMPLIDALQRRFFGPGVAAMPPSDPGTFEAPAAVSPRGLFVALPKVALVTHDDRTWAHLVHVARPSRSQNFEVAYRRSKKAAQDRSFETNKTLAAPGDGWAITDLAIAAHGDKVSVAWTQTQTGPKAQPKQSLVRVAESHSRGAHFFAPRTVRKNDAWKRGLSLGYDRFGHLHLVWGEAHKVYYLKDFTKEPENVFDVVVREKNDLVVSYALAHKNPLCRKPMAPCGCIEWSHEAYSYALETNPKTGEAFGPYRTRTEEAFVYNPSLTIDDDAVSIIAHQDRMWDNRAVPNPDWPLEKNVTPDEAEGTCPQPGTRIAQVGFQEIWQKRAHDLEPQRHLEETPGTNPSGPQEGAGSDTPDNKTHHQYLYDGTWHEEDQIRIAQRPLVEDAWSEPSTGMRDDPVWPMREGLLEWKTAEVPVEEGFKVGTFQNGVRQDWRHAVVAPLQSPLHEGRHDAPKLAVKKPGHLVAVYSDGPSGKAHIPGQNPIFVTQSLDGGITWSPGTQVAHGYLPDAAATHDGEVGLLVYHLGAPGRASPPAPKIDILRTRDLQVWDRDTLNLYPPIPLHRTHHENGAHHESLFDDPIGVPALSGHQALFVATWVRSEIDPQPGTRIVTTRAARARETRRYEITHAGPLTVGQSTQFTITAVNAYDMRVRNDGKVHLGVAPRGPGGIRQGSPHTGTNPLRPGREAVDQAVPDPIPLSQVRPNGGPIDQALTHWETKDATFRSENAANPAFRSENAQALALVDGKSPPATVQLQNGQATFVRMTHETDTTLLVQSEEDPTGRASATTLLAYASGAAGNYQRAIEARDRMMRTVVDEATQQTWVFQVEYAPEANPQPGDASTGLASPLEEPGVASDARYLASFERVWVYTQGIAVAQLSKQQDKVSQAAAQGMARYLCAHAEKGHHEGRTVILGWPFSWNTAGDNWKDRRLVTGANAWAIHGLGVFVASEAFDSLSDKEQIAIRGCYEEAIRGLLVHRRRLVAPGTDHTVSLVTAGWTAQGLTVAENPSALFTEEEESVQWGYYSVLDAIGYDAFTEDRAPEVARFRHTPGAPPTKLEPRVLTEQDHQRLKTRVLASNVVTEHNLDVLSVLNHALRHQEKIGLQDFTELEVFRDELRDGIFVLLWDDQEYTQDLAYTLRQTGPDDPRRPALEEALEAQDLGRIVTGGHFSGTGEDLHFSASNHVAIDNCSWLSLSVDHGLLPEQPEYIERLARCLRYTELQFVKPLPFAGRTYLGAHYFQNTFRDPYISPSVLQESSYHLEATTGLILGLARFARAYPEHPDAGHFADQTRALWNGVQLFVKDHGFRYSSQRIQDLSTLLASSTAAIWFIDVYRELNQDWAGLRGIVGTGRVWDPERLAASSLAHKNVVSLGLYGGHEAFVGFQSQSGATWVDTKAPRSDGSVGVIYPEAQSTLGSGARATKPGTVLANVIKKGAASIDEFSPGTSFATSQLLAAGTALASIVALSTGQVETWTTLIHLNQAPNVHTEPWTFVGTVPEDEVTFLGLFFKDEALIRHTRIQQSHVQGGFATSTVEFEADAIYGLVKEVYGPSEGMLKDLYRLGLPTGEPISVYRLDTELSPETIVGAVLDQQVPWLKPSADSTPNEPGFTADLFRELRALALTPDFHQIDLAELIHTLENQGAAPDSRDAQTIIPESPSGTAWLDQVPEAFRASVYYWTVLLPQYVAPQSSGPLWDALQNDLSRLDEDTCRTLGPTYVSRFPGAQVGWVPGSGNLPGRCVITHTAGSNPADDTNPPRSNTPEPNPRVPLPAKENQAPDTPTAEQNDSTRGGRRVSGTVFDSFFYEAFKEHVLYYAKKYDGNQAGLRALFQLLERDEQFTGLLRDLRLRILIGDDESESFHISRDGTSEEAHIYAVAGPVTAANLRALFGLLIAVLQQEAILSPTLGSRRELILQTAQGQSITRTIVAPEFQDRDFPSLLEQAFLWHEDHDVSMFTQRFEHGLSAMALDGNALSARPFLATTFHPKSAEYQKLEAEANAWRVDFIERLTRRSTPKPIQPLSEAAVFGMRLTSLGAMQHSLENLVDWDADAPLDVTIYDSSRILGIPRDPDGVPQVSIGTAKVPLQTSSAPLEILFCIISTQNGHRLAVATNWRRGGVREPLFTHLPSEPTQFQILEKRLLELALSTHAEPLPPQDIASIIGPSFFEGVLQGVRFAVPVTFDDDDNALIEALESDYFMLHLAEGALRGGHVGFPVYAYSFAPILPMHTLFFDVSKKHVLKVWGPYPLSSPTGRSGIYHELVHSSFPNFSKKAKRKLYDTFSNDPYFKDLLQLIATNNPSLQKDPAALQDYFTTEAQCIWAEMFRMAMIQAPEGPNPFRVSPPDRTDLILEDFATAATRVQSGQIEKQAFLDSARALLTKLGPTGSTTPDYFYEIFATLDPDKIRNMDLPVTTERYLLQPGPMWWFGGEVFPKFVRTILEDHGYKDRHAVWSSDEDATAVWNEISDQAERALDAYNRLKQRSKP